MAHDVTVAAIKTAISDAIDAHVSQVQGTPYVKELEAVLQTTISELKAAGTISSTERVQDA